MGVMAPLYAAGWASGEIAGTRVNDLEQSFQAMSRVKMNSNRPTEYLAAVYPDTPEPDKQQLVLRGWSGSEYFFDQEKGNRSTARQAGSRRQFRDGL